jgi:Cu-processing system ATP-binding protein
MITIRGLVKRFGRLDVLRGIDLDIQPGRVTAIVGPNGAGKTTLIKTMLGLSRPDAGTLIFDGVPIHHDDPAYRARIGYMPQIARFPDNLTAADLLCMLADLRPESTAMDRGLVERFGLDPHLTKPLRTLSGGTRQKMNAVMAFMFEPELLILDEPTAGLDPVSSAILKDTISAARADGRTVILTSHVMSELEELADDVAFLLDGQVRFAGAVHDLKLRTRQFSLERALAHMMLQLEAA